MEITMKLVSPLTKVFLDEEPPAYDTGRVSGFINETVSFQAAYRITGDTARGYVNVRVESPICEIVRIRRVQHVPVRFPTFYDADENYLREKKPGLYPDLLSEYGEFELHAYNNSWQSLWIDVEPDRRVAPGVYPVTISVCKTGGEPLATCTQTVEFLPAELPPQRLIHTKWFHSDCLAAHYGVPVFSEEYWRITENFMRAAVKRGINMILTPVHTPPIDTRIGGERPTVQLVDVRVNDGAYGFGFEKLRRWVGLCKECGYLYYEIAHFFTQWGALYTPKIMAVVDGREKRIFGWDVKATSAEYREFTAAYIPALLAELKALGIDGASYFHISDEPGKEHIDGYKAAKDVVADLLKGYPVMDALSDVEFYRSGAVEKPIPGINHMEPFLAAGVKNLWTYYCVAQYADVSNMFIAMPSARNRILGVLLYKYNIEGLLQWGYNFYFSQNSDYPVDPYFITDGDGFVPAGDAYQVYPRKDGRPEESIRMMVTSQALYDMRALELLESLTDRGFVLSLIDGGLEEPVTFKLYPKTEEYLFNLRRKVESEIMKRSPKDAGSLV